MKIVTPENNSTHADAHYGTKYMYTLLVKSLHFAFYVICINLATLVRVLQHGDIIIKYCSSPLVTAVHADKYLHDIIIFLLSPFTQL